VARAALPNGKPRSPHDRAGAKDVPIPVAAGRSTARSEQLLEHFRQDRQVALQPLRHDLRVTRTGAAKEAQRSFR
jgi:hypothetical protein